MAKILITGAKGLVGRRLVVLLKKQGHVVFVLTRNKAAANQFEWNLESGFIEEGALINIDHVIHLAGETIAQRWKSKKIQLIHNSRVRSIQLLFNKMKNCKTLPKTFVCASAVGYYGNDLPDREFTEEDSNGNDFLAQVCTELENTAEAMSGLGIRVVKLRTGIVVSDDGGFISKISTFAKLGLFFVFGKGDQFVPWIHVDDLCSIYIKAINDNKMQGAYNATSPQHITHLQMMRALALNKNKGALIISIPSFIINLIFGKMAQVLLKGNKVSCKKLLANGYDFIYAKFESTLQK